MTLTWDPPGRWRMDVSSARETFTLISTPDGRYVCRGDVGAKARCLAESPTESKSDAPFGLIFRSPAQILDEINGQGVDAVTRTSERTITGILAECFSATGGPGQAMDHLAWCYSKAGILLYFLSDVEGAGSTMLEAIEVSPHISDEDFTYRSS